MSKLKFRVVYSTSEDEAFPVVELNNHTPQTKGYSTKQYCSYPQELILQLVDGECLIKQIQILSHRYKIASKIELFIGFGGPTLPQCQFKRLGYLSLSTNEQSDFKARELKSVYIDDQRGSFIKFAIHESHVNSLNHYNQVGIVAINIKGDPLDDRSNLEQSSIAQGIPLDNVVPSLRSNRAAQKSTPMDDLAFDMHFDETTARKIRSIHAAKLQAVEVEDYERAKKLKLLEEELKSVGIQLARLERDKREAVDDEDYDLAKRLKDEMAFAQENINSKLRSLDLDDVYSAPIPPHQSPMRNKKLEDATAMQQSMPRLPDFSNSTIPPPPQRSPQKTSQPKGAIPYTDKPISTPRQSLNAPEIAQNNEQFPTPSKRAINPDERPINQNSSFNEQMMRESLTEQPSEEQPEKGLNPNFEDIPGAEHLDDPEELPPVLQQEAASMIAIFGEFVTRCHYSGVWNHRDAAFRLIERDISQYDYQSMNVIREFAKLIESGCNDRNTNVFLGAIKVLQLLGSCTTSIDQHSLCNILLAVVTSLTARLGDGQQRVREGAFNSLFQLGCHPVIGEHFVIESLLKQAKRLSSSWKALLGRLKLLRDFLSNSETLVQEVSIDDIMKFMSTYHTLSHQNPELRDASRDISAHFFLIIGHDIEKYLTSLRPKALEEYRKAFQKASRDGPPKGGSKMKASSSITATAPTTTQKSTSVKKKSVSAREYESVSPPPEKSEVEQIEYCDDEDELDGSVDDFTCQFCGRRDDCFTEEGLDRHYWSECEMLISCSQCEQVIEISCLNEHLLFECENKNNHQQCQQCGEAIQSRFYEEHTKRNDCPPKLTLKEANRCPLCHTNIPSRLAGWRQHLLIDKCERNPRSH